MCMSLCRGRVSAFVSSNTWWNTRTCQLTSMPMTSPRLSCSASSASTSIWHHIRPKPTTLSSLTSTLAIAAHRLRPVSRITRGSRRRLATTTTISPTPKVETKIQMRSKSSEVQRRINRKASNNSTAITSDSAKLPKNRKSAKLHGLHSKLSLNSNIKHQCPIGQQRKTNPRDSSMSHLNIKLNHALANNLRDSSAPLTNMEAFSLGEWDDWYDQQTDYWLSIIQLFL